jgi:hypothetical protein
LHGEQNPETDESNGKRDPDEDVDSHGCAKASRVKKHPAERRAA